MDWWRWVEGFRVLNYAMKLAKDSVISKITKMTRMTSKWQGYLPSNYMLYWSHVEPLPIWQRGCIHVVHLAQGGHCQ